jgi:hypothetical protein
MPARMGSAVRHIRVYFAALTVRDVSCAAHASHSPPLLIGMGFPLNGALMLLSHLPGASTLDRSTAWRMLRPLISAREFSFNSRQPRPAAHNAAIPVNDWIHAANKM